MKTQISRYAKALVSAAALAVLPACALFKSTTNQSSLPVEVVHANSGQIASTRTYESATRLFVAGSAGKGFGYSIHPAAHVDIQLLDAAGNVIAEQQDDIDPSHPQLTKARHGYSSYVASFPIAEARKAAKVRVIYHPAVHAAAQA